MLRAAPGGGSYPRAGRSFTTHIETPRTELQTFARHARFSCVMQRHSAHRQQQPVKPLALVDHHHVFGPIENVHVGAGNHRLQP